MIVGERFHDFREVVADGPTNAVESDDPFVTEALERFGRYGDGICHLVTVDQSSFWSLGVRADARRSVSFLHC